MTRSPLSFNCADQAQPSWLDRAVKCAELLREVRGDAPHFVLSDVGCGDRKLQNCLAEEGVQVDYRGYDLVPQSDAVRPLDVSAQTPEPGSDVIVLLGVVEYLDDLGGVLRRLGESCRWLVVSHVVSDFSAYAPERLRELGWKQHLSQQAFEQVLQGAGLAIDKRVRTANGKTLLWRCRASKGSTA